MNKSFTLIEILVVIVVIGIISSFIIVGLSSVSDKANIAKGQAFINSLDNSMLLARISSWKLDEGTGTSVSDSWGTNNGTLYNFDFNNLSGWMLENDCVSGYCLRFDNIDDYVNFGTGSDFDITEKITISFWIKSNSSETQYIIRKEVLSTIWYGFRVDLDGGLIRWYVWTNTNPSPLSYNFFSYDDKWTNVVASYHKNAGRKMYINGTMVNSDTLSGLIGSTVQPCMLGTNSVYTMSGYIDEVKVYKDVLSSLIIDEDYYSGLNKLLKNKGITINEFNNKLSNLKLNNY